MHQTTNLDHPNFSKESYHLVLYGGHLLFEEPIPIHILLDRLQGFLENLGTNFLYDLFSTLMFNYICVYIYLCIKTIKRNSIVMGFYQPKQRNFSKQKQSERIRKISEIRNNHNWIKSLPIPSSLIWLKLRLTSTRSILFFETIKKFFFVLGNFKDKTNKKKYQKLLINYWFSLISKGSKCL